jgi:dUTPase
MESMNINIKLLNDKAVIPFKANDDDANACYDVVATSISYNVDDKYVEYGLGFATEFSSDYEYQVRPRSSLSKYDLTMCNAPGTIDSNYRGEWKVRFKVSDFDAIENIKSETTCDENGGYYGSRFEFLSRIHDGDGFKHDQNAVDKYISKLGRFYKVGDRIAQISPNKVIKSVFNKVDELNTSLRGDGGFGSTNANA